MSDAESIATRYLLFNSFQDSGSRAPRLVSHEGELAFGHAFYIQHDCNHAESLSRNDGGTKNSSKIRAGLRRAINYRIFRVHPDFHHSLGIESGKLTLCQNS